MPAAGLWKTTRPRRVRQRPLLPALVLVLLIELLSTSAAEDARTNSQAEPFVVVAVAGVDRLLDDFDALFLAAEQPQYARFVRGVIGSLNELRGIDRGRPLGMLGFLTPAQPEGMQAVLFAPVSRTDELLETVEMVKSLRLTKGAADGQFTLHTDSENHPVMIHNGFAFVDVTKRENSADAVEIPAVDPALLVGDVLRTRDALVIFRRDGVPQEVLQTISRKLEESAEQDRQLQPGESDTEFAIRRQISGEAWDWAREIIAEWDSTALGLSIGGPEGGVQLQADIVFDRDGSISGRLAAMEVGETRFAEAMRQPSPLTVACSLSAPPGISNIVEMVVNSSREAVDEEWERLDDESRTALGGMIAAVEQTFRAGRLDAYLQLRETATAKFTLVGGIAIDEAERVSQGLLQLLPLAADSAAFRDVSLRIGSQAGIAIHRLRPEKLRPDDRRLYGDDAAFYVAAGQGALWIAVGESEALPALKSAIRETSRGPMPAQTPSPRCGRDNADAPQANSRPLLEITIHARPWLELHGPDAPEHSSKMLSLARDAFADPDADRAHLAVRVTDDGLSLSAEFGEGYFALLGRTLAERMSRR